MKIGDRYINGVIQKKEEAENESRDTSETSAEQSSNLSDELTKLNDLKEKGIISQEEFEKAKNKLLNN